MPVISVDTARHTDVFPALQLTVSPQCHHSVTVYTTLYLAGMRTSVLPVLTVTAAMTICICFFTSFRPSAVTLDPALTFDPWWMMRRRVSGPLQFHPWFVQA